MKTSRSRIYSARRFSNSPSKSQSNAAAFSSNNNSSFHDQNDFFPSALPLDNTQHVSSSSSSSTQQNQHQYSSRNSSPSGPQYHSDYQQLKRQQQHHNHSSFLERTETDSIRQQRIDTSGDSALQFIPSYTHAASSGSNPPTKQQQQQQQHQHPTRNSPLRNMLFRRRTATSSSNNNSTIQTTRSDDMLEATWDAIIEAKTAAKATTTEPDITSSSGRHASPSKSTSPTSPRVRTSSSSPTLHHRRQAQSQQVHHQKYSVVPELVHNRHTSPGSISRFRALFSSRATVSTTNKQPRHTSPSLTRTGTTREAAKRLLEERKDEQEDRHNNDDDLAFHNTSMESSSGSNNHHYYYHYHHHHQSINKITNDISYEVEVGAAAKLEMQQWMQDDDDDEDISVQDSVSFQGSLPGQQKRQLQQRTVMENGGSSQQPQLRRQQQQLLQSNALFQSAYDSKHVVNNRSEHSGIASPKGQSHYFDDHHSPQTRRQNHHHPRRPDPDGATVRSPDVDLSKPYSLASSLQGRTLPISGSKTIDSSSPSLSSASPPVTLSKEMLERNDQLTPPIRMGFNANNVRGYTGFLNKMQDLPNLMDDDTTIEGSSSISQDRHPTNHNNAKSNNHGGAVLNVNVSANRWAEYKKRRAAEQQQSQQRQQSSYIPFLAPGRALGAGHDEDSDVFSGIFSSDQEDLASGSRRHAPVAPYQSRRDEGALGNNMMLARGLTQTQTIPEVYNNREIPNEFNTSLSTSSVDQFGHTSTPAHTSMLAAGHRPHDSAHQILSNIQEHARVDKTGALGGSIWDTSFGGADTGSDDSHVTPEMFGHTMPSSIIGDLSEYRVTPEQSKLLVKAFRHFTKVVNENVESYDELDVLEDSRKAFALSEMRSRIMEKDLERGLERRGGTVVVDDIVLTPHFQAGCRVRDAVIVSKAWRDGASPRDVETAHKMTRRHFQTFYLVRRVNRPVIYQGGRYGGLKQFYEYEQIQWMDDTDFMQMRCPSLGPRTMKGFEIFTVGDCQSILLKLSNERCVQLRRELKEATAEQYEAKAWVQMNGNGDETLQAKMLYLSSKDKVRSLSRQVVAAEHAFNLVRSRIEKLVARYEAMLVKIENESIATTSAVSYGETTYYSDEENSDEENSFVENADDTAMFQLRAEKAELRAFRASQEATAAKQEAAKIQTEKQKEIEALQQRLLELQLETSHTVAERENTSVLAKSIAQNNSGEAASSHGGRTAASWLSQDQINGVKQKFRNRMADRMRNRSKSSSTRRSVVSTYTSHTGSSESAGSSAIMSSYYGPGFERPIERPPMTAKSHRRQLVGEEMYQHLDFYERSLRAVDSFQ